MQNPRIQHIGNEAGIRMSGTLGRVEEFNGSSGEDWSQYVEQLKHFFVANGIVSTKKHAVLLSVVGISTLRNLVSPAKPGETHMPSWWVNFRNTISQCLRRSWNGLNSIAITGDPGSQ